MHVMRGGDGRGAYAAFVEPWLACGEPTVACAECDEAYLLGDRSAPWGYAIGAPAVCFNNWAPLPETFLVDLRARVSNRKLVVRAHS